MNGDHPDIYHTPVRRGLALAWVNSYSAVVVKSPGTTLLFDPVGMAVPEDAPLDLIAVSHGHSDHWHPSLVAELRARTQAPVLLSPHLAFRLTGGAINGSARGGPGLVSPVVPGHEVTIADLTVTALRCDHAAAEPLAFQIRTGDGLTVYLPGDTTPFPEMEELPHPSGPSTPLRCAQDDWLSADPPGSQKPKVDVLFWTGTVLRDGAEIARLVQPRQFLTYAIAPPAAGERAYAMLTALAPDTPFHPLARHEVFWLPPKTRSH